MKRNILLLGFMLWAAVLYGQTGAINTPAMAAVLPPAPNASELTRYNGMPLNLSTGSANFNIPLGAITQGKLKVPISLSYSGGNGVKVDQMASYTGMNWVLNAGGVITRTVYGNPDETSRLKAYPEGTPSNDTLFNFLHSVTDNIAYDSAPDQFSFNFNGYSGQFILDPAYPADTVAIMLTPSPLKFKFNLSNNAGIGNWTIRITDPQGVEYYFGGSSATESTKSLQVGGGCGRNYEAFIPTAWYLIKIKDYNGDEINFTYLPITYDYYTSASQTLIRTPVTTAVDQYNYMNQNAINMIFDPENPAVSAMVTCPQKAENQNCATYLRTNGVTLAWINSKMGQATFAYNYRPDGNYLLYSVLFDKIDPADSTSYSTVKYYTLGYIHSSNNKQNNTFLLDTNLRTRPYLKYVRANVPTGEEYRMNYYNINGLPSRLSLSQDYWGYYNDHNNTVVVPRSNDTEIANLFNTAVANRNPDGAKSYYGMLSSISYPTGGRDSLVYEPNTIWEEREILPNPANTQLSKQGTGTSTTQTLTHYFNNHVSTPTTFYLRTDYGYGTVDPLHNHTVFRLYDASNTLLFNHLVKVDSTKTVTLNLHTQTYRLEIHASGTSAIGKVEILYQPPGSMVWNNYQVGGVRVARNISRPIIGAAFEKRLIYASLAYQTRSSGRIAYAPSPEHYYANLPIHTGDDFKQCMYKVAYSNPTKSYNYYSGGHIFYTDVIEVNSPTWENGGIAHKYIGSDGGNAIPQLGNEIHGTPLDNLGYGLGLETLAYTFKKTGGSAGAYTYAPVSEVKTTYKMDSRLTKRTYAYTVRRKWTNLVGHSPRFAYELNQFDVAKYPLDRQWIYPDTVISKIYDMHTVNPVTTQQVTLYDNTGHLQPTQVKTLRSDGKTSTLKFKYPADMVAAGITAPYTTMVNRNRVVAEIVKSKHLDTALIETVTTVYDTFSGGVVEPKKQQYKQKWGTNHDFVSFDGYDAGARLVTQSATNGPKVSYQYGYKNNRVVAECRNALSTEFYHQNFEELSTATAGTAHTGKRYYNGDYTVSWPRLTPINRIYKITYWYLDGSTWKFKEKEYTGTTTLTDGSAIDDINIFPEDAFMKTYTYDVFDGMTSVIDEKGMTTYYEYAETQLLYVKDHEGNIVKSYYNNLTGPKIEYFSAAQSQAFTKVCSPGTGTSVTYAVPAGAYVSLISQTDANNKALADIAANGQNHANANGTCISGDISLSYEQDPGVTDYLVSLVVKNGAGTILWTFNNTDLVGGIDIPKGTYTFEYTLSGTTWPTIETTTSNYYNNASNNGLTTVTVNNVTLTVNTGTIRVGNAS